MARQCRQCPSVPRDSVCEPQQQNDKEVGQANLGCSGPKHQIWIEMLGLSWMAMDQNEESRGMSPCAGLFQDFQAKC